MIDLVVSVATPKLAMLAHLAPHPCPRTGKCCGRCKLAIPGDAAHLPSLHPSAHGNESHAGLEQDKENLFRFLALAGSVDADMEY